MNLLNLNSMINNCKPLSTILSDYQLEDQLYGTVQQNSYILSIILKTRKFKIKNFRISKIGS